MPADWLFSALQVVDFSNSALSALKAEHWENFTCIVVILELIANLPDTLRDFAESEGLQSPALEPRAATLCGAGV